MFGWSGWHDKHLNRGLDSFSIMTVMVGNRDRLHCTVQYIMSLSSHWMVGVEGLLAFVFGRYGIKKGLFLLLLLMSSVSLSSLRQQVRPTSAQVSAVVW